MVGGGTSPEDQWALAPAERELVMTKNRANRLGFAILLTFFRERAGFRATKPKSKRKESSR